MKKMNHYTRAYTCTDAHTCFILHTFLALYRCIFPTVQLCSCHAQWGSPAEHRQFVSCLSSAHCSYYSLITRNVASQRKVMISFLHVRCLTHRDDNERNRLDVMRVNLALFAYWWGLHSIYLALSVLLINTNCVTSGATPMCTVSTSTWMDWSENIGITAVYSYHGETHW